jgi:hypothetical protein
MTTFSVTKCGIPLDPSLYTWDENTKTFSSYVDGLVLDFADIFGVTFKTGPFCTLFTSHSCTFLTDPHCVFNTGHSCTFKTGYDCTFHTGYDCKFNTRSDCTFKTGPNCIFKVGGNCCLIRLDVKGVTEIPKDKKIKLNDYRIAGYTVIE